MGSFTAEQRNGLIRSQFSRGTVFARLWNADAAQVESAINNRPMMRLGFRTPLEVTPHLVARRC